LKEEKVQKLIPIFEIMFLFFRPEWMQREVHPLGTFQDTLEGVKEA
jgi:hypothetical protein